MNKYTGFTLIELMVVVIVIAILAAIALPSYQAYARRALAAQAQQQVQQVAALLERHKARNFSYKGFDLTTQGITAPRTYSYELKDETNKLLSASDASGRSWLLKATTTDSRNFNLLMTSSGIRCKNLTANNISITGTIGCGTGEEPW